MLQLNLSSLRASSTFDESFLLDVVSKLTFVCDLSHNESKSVKLFR